MRITRLKVGPSVYGIAYTALGHLADDGRFADVCHRTETIRLPSEGAPRHVAGLLVHELLHCLFDDTGLGLSREEEERLVSALSPRLTALLGDNPDEIRELLKMLRR